MPAYPHLKIDREQPVNEKRPAGRVFTRPPENIPAHARRLQESLERARETATQSLGGFDDRFHKVEVRVVRITFYQWFQIKKPRGIEFLQHE